MVLVAIVLIIGLGFLGCDTKKASVINGPQDIGVSDYTTSSATVKPDSIQINYEVLVGDCFFFEDTMPAEVVTATVSGNSINVQHLNAPNQCCSDIYVAGAHVTQSGKVFTIQEFDTSTTEWGCADMSLRDYGITIHDVPTGLYTIVVRGCVPWSYHTVKVAVNCRSIYDETADI